MAYRCKYLAGIRHRHQHTRARAHTHTMHTHNAHTQCTRTHMHARTHARIQCILTRKAHTQSTNTNAHTHAHTHARTHAHIHTQPGTKWQRAEIIGVSGRILQLNTTWTFGDVPPTKLKYAMSDYPAMPFYNSFGLPTPPFELNINSCID